jgi:hypothetical protein
MVFAAFLLPPGLLCLVLALGRCGEWLLRQSAPPQSARHARTKRRALKLLGDGRPGLRSAGTRPADPWSTCNVRH